MLGFFFYLERACLSSFMLSGSGMRESVRMCEGVRTSVPIQSLKWEKTPFVVHTGGISDGDNSAKQKGTS